MSIKREDLYKIFTCGFEVGMWEVLYRNDDYTYCNKREQYYEELNKRFGEIMFLQGNEMLANQEVKTDE